MKRKLIALVLALMLFSMLAGCGIDVPRPAIKSREFNYSVTYEYTGETKTVSGVYVCEYAGLSWSLDGGYSRDWKGYIKGGTEDDFIKLDDFEDGDELFLALNLRPDYLMDDFNEGLYEIPVPYMRVHDYTEDGGLRIIRDAADVEEFCGARIISFEYDKPIENNYSVFNF